MLIRAVWRAFENQKFLNLGKKTRLTLFYLFKMLFTYLIRSNNNLNITACSKRDYAKLSNPRNKPHV